METMAKAFVTGLTGYSLVTTYPRLATRDTTVPRHGGGLLFSPTHMKMPKALFRYTGPLFRNPHAGMS